MPDVRLLVVSDTHLSHLTPEAVSNVGALVAHAEATAPDAVLHLGDVCVDAPKRPDDLVVARDALAGFGPVGERLHLVPGNHDIGDGPHGELGDEPPVNAATLERYTSVFGADRWRLDLGRWTLVGFNAQLVDTGTELEGEQWDWLAAETAAAGAAQRYLAVCTHKPMVLADAADPGGRRPSRYLPEAAADRVMSMATAAGVRLVLSGHVHQWRRFDRDGVLHVWAPTAWAVLPDEIQDVLGEKVCGALEVVLGDDGSVGLELVQPPGFVHHVGGVTVASPYRH